MNHGLVCIDTCNISFQHFISDTCTTELIPLIETVAYQYRQAFGQSISLVLQCISLGFISQIFILSDSVSHYCDCEITGSVYLDPDVIILDMQIMAYRCDL